LQDDRLGASRGRHRGVAETALVEKPVLDLDPDMDSRLHLAAIIESSDDPIITWNMDGTIISWNKAATRVFGYSHEEIVGKSVLRLIPEDLHDEEENLVRKLKAGGSVRHFETTCVRKTGERFPVSVTVLPVRDTKGQVIGLSKIVRDVSDKKTNDESRFRLAAIVDSAEDAIVSKDLNGVVRTWNEGAHRTFGYTAEEMVGQPILKLIPNEIQHEEDEILRKLRAGERIEHYETTRRRKNGENIEVSVTISPIRDESGKVIGASKIARDISDRKRTERLLVQSEKLAATGRMATAIAHEINNPLESLMNLIFLARRVSPPGGEAHELLVTAEGELARVCHLARQTLGYYRDTNSPTEVYIHDLVENVLTVYKSKLMASGITVDRQFNDLQKIAVSKGEMLQVISNIVANAIDAMRARGKLWITTRKVTGAIGDGIQLLVRDNGTGIEQEHLGRIFEPFFTTKGEMGTGIGLWVAKQLVERRGGQISVATSTEPEKSGTAITVFVPFAIPGASRLGAV
jgi:PAS domain S-box-containing protein